MKTQCSLRLILTGFSLMLALPVAQAASIAITNASFDVDENTDSTGRYGEWTRDDNDGTPDNNVGEFTGWIHQSNNEYAPIVEGGPGVPVGAGVSVGWKDWNAGQLHLDPAITDGREAQTLGLQSGASVLNTTGTAWSSFNVGDELTLTIAVGLRNVGVLNWTENAFFGLTDGSADFTTVGLADTVANTGLIANNPATGTQLGNGDMADVSFTHSITLADLSRSGNVGILVYAQGEGGLNSQNQAHFDNVRLDLTAIPEPSAALLGGLGTLLLLRRRRS